MTQYIKKYWYTFLTLLAVDICVAVYFLSNGEDTIIYSAILSCLYLIVMPTMGVYNKIFQSRVLKYWLLLNVLVMGIYVISIVKGIF